MNIIRQAPIVWLFRNTVESLKMLKMDRSSWDIAVLENRLIEAERRIALLFNEITDIRAKLTIAKQINNSATSSAIDHNLASTSGVKRTLSDAPKPATKRNKEDFNIEDGYVVVYCDGACENNGKPGARAGIGVWFGDNNPLNVSQPVIGRATNNTAEIQACVAAATTIKENGYTKVKFFTDSEFVIKCMTQWIQKWKLNNWKATTGNDVKNKEDLMKLDAILKSFQDVKWEYVRGHSGVKGNEEADKLARSGALRYQP